MTVSLIVPVYKAELWIEECMASIKAQTYKDIELIVIKDPHRTGAAAARNRGLDKATGEYVAFCDADDYLVPYAIETMVAAMEGVDMVCGSFRKFGKFEQIVSAKTERMSRKAVASYAMGNMRNPRTNQMLSGCWAKLYRRSMIGRFPNITTAEDMAFNFDYLRLCFRDVIFIPYIVYHNRKHEGSLTTTFDDKDRRGLFGFMEGLKYVKCFLSSFYSEEELESAIDNFKIYHSVLYAQRVGPDALGQLFPLENSAC